MIDSVRARRRGQNMVLLALTMLIVSLMVLITLGIAQRIRENHEINNVADAAAYSSAVVNARAYNNIAVLNRLQVSYWVSMTANESLISWTSYARALWNATIRNLEQIRRPWDPTKAVVTDCDRARRDAYNSYVQAWNDFKAAEPTTPWRKADQAAGTETILIQGMIDKLRSETRGLPFDTVAFPRGMRERLFKERRTQTVAQRVLAESGLTDVRLVPITGSVGAADISGREVGDYGLNSVFDSCSDLQNGLCIASSRGSWSDQVVEAAMGTRGSDFVLNRGVIPPIVSAEWAKLQGLVNSTITQSGGTPVGSAYFDTVKSHSGRTTGVADGRYAWGDDDGDLSTAVSYGTCNLNPVASGVWSYVQTTDLTNSAQGDKHDWDPDDYGIDKDTTAFAEQFHTAGDCRPLCPSVWVREVNFNPNHEADDAWGQPKTEVMLVRDEAKITEKSQPWRLNFRFGFSSTGSRFDNRGTLLHGQSTGAGLDISSQSAVATGMAYYHRKDRWLEFPNLLNPFWRATLVPADVDRKSTTGANDMQKTLYRAEEKWQADAYDQLIKSGFKGVH